MGRTIKLLLYYFAYQLAFNGVFICSYMIYNHTTEVPGISDGPYFNLLLWASVLATVAIGIHLLVGKYASVHPVQWNTPQTIKIGLSSIVLVTGMGLWTNYLNELADLPNNFQEMFDKMMHHPLGIVSIVILAPLVEELLFRGSIQGHLLRKWKNPAWAILFSSLIFGAVHGNPVQIPFAFVLGTALGWMYYRTGSLLPSILMHFVNNGTAVCTFLFAEDPQATLISTYGTGAVSYTHLTLPTTSRRQRQMCIRDSGSRPDRRQHRIHCPADSAGQRVERTGSHAVSPQAINLITKTF